MSINRSTILYMARHVDIKYNVPLTALAATTDCVT